MTTKPETQPDRHVDGSAEVAADVEPNAADVLPLNEPTDRDRLARVLQMIDEQSTGLQKILDNLAVMRTATLAKLAGLRPTDAHLAEPRLRLVTTQTADVPDADADTIGIDFMELASTPNPAVAPDFDRRVDVVVAALRGLDRHGIHGVLESAGRIARAAASR